MPAQQCKEHNFVHLRNYVCEGKNYDVFYCTKCLTIVAINIEDNKFVRNAAL